METSSAAGVDDHDNGKGKPLLSVMTRLIDPFGIEKRLELLCPVTNTRGDPSQCEGLRGKAEGAEGSAHAPVTQLDLEGPARKKAAGSTPCVLLNWLAAILVGWLLWPLTMPLRPAGRLDAFESWAMRGPGREIPSPLMGCYTFHGLGPLLLVDLSHAHTWDSRSRSFFFEMGGPGVHVLDTALPSDLLSDGKHSSAEQLLPSLSGAWLLRLFRLVRYSSKVVLSEDGRHARVLPTFFFESSPLTILSRRMLRMELEARAPGFLAFLSPGGVSVWKGSGFRPSASAAPICSFWLHPVLTAWPSKTLRTHRSGVAMAARKSARAVNSQIVHFE